MLFAPLDANAGEEIFAIENNLSGHASSSVYHNRTKAATNPLYCYAGRGSVYSQGIAGLGRNQIAWCYPNGIPAKTPYHAMTLDEQTGTYRH